MKRIQHIAGASYGLILAALLHQPCVLADQSVLPAASVAVIEQISVAGLKRTHPEVVLRELSIAENQPLEPAHLEDSLQRLRNLELFSRVSSDLHAGENGTSLTINLKEKWTTMPFFRYTVGGGDSYLVTGIYDINTLGRYIETGIQYESWNQQHGGVVWFRHPRWRGQRLKLGADLWKITRPRTLYNHSGQFEGRYLLERQRINLILEKEFIPRLAFGIQFDSSTDHLTLSGATHDIAYAPRSSVNLIHLTSRLGELNRKRIRTDGHETRITISRSARLRHTDLEFWRASLVHRHYFLAAKRHNLAWHARTGITSTKMLQHQFFLGGLNHVRGYYASQIRGQAFWQNNLEYRIHGPSIRGIIPQMNIFIDTAGVNGGQTLYSAGTGIRIIAPQIYRFTARMDIAVLTSEPAGNRISIGAQQFF